MDHPDAVVVGSGPNGLAAAITLARAGLAVTVYEGAATPGGGTRTEDLTIDGFHHDVCSAVHPSLLASPFFQSLDLDALGIRILQSELPFAHPLHSGRAAALQRSMPDTAATLGVDGSAYRALMEPLVDQLDDIVPYVLGPMRSVPRHPLTMTRFALRGIPSARHLGEKFKTEEARALIAGPSAHSVEPLTGLLTSSFGLLLAALGHEVGWPVVEGGSGAIAAGLVQELERLGGTVVTGQMIGSLAELPMCRAILLDTSPRQFIDLAGPRLSADRARPYARFRPAPGTCKVDWALSGPVPWTAPECRRAVTVHVGGPMEEVMRSEYEVNAGRHPDRPFTLVAQPSLVDPTRAPAGRHSLWAYCHVPNGSSFDMTDRIEAQMERFAPGFGDLVLARSTRTADQAEAHNPNLLGGDVVGGAATLRQTFARPVARWNSYRTPVDGTYLCSASTPPGGGVHGMSGYWAARTVLRERFGHRGPT